MRIFGIEEVKDVDKLPNLGDLFPEYKSKQIKVNGLNDKEMMFALYLLKKANKIQLSKLIREEHFNNVDDEVVC